MSPSLLLLAGVGLLTGGALTVVFVRAPAVGVSLLLAAGLWPAAHRETVVHAGVDLTVQDLLVCCALAAAAVNVVRRTPAARRALLLLMVILLLTAGSFAVGVSSFGLQAAGNDMRAPFLYVFGLALYGLTLTYDATLVRRLAAVWVAAACVEVLLAGLWWTENGIGSAVGQVLVGGVASESRALSAPEALIIAQAAVLVLFASSFGARRYLLAAPLLVAVVLLQHRTVWLATAVMVGVWLLAGPGTDGTGRKADRQRRGLRIGLAVTAVGVGVFAVSSGLLGRLGAGLTVSASDSGTLAWRASGWSALLGTLDGFGDWLTGRPFGAGFDRLVDGRIVVVSPHNYFLHILLRIGLAGLLSFLALYASTLAGALRHRRRPVGRAVGALACSQLVFALTYQLCPEQGLVLGALCALTAGVPLRRETGPARPATPERTRPRAATTHS
ncbi:O-antigen ligase family protein [Streptomyces sp. NPDC048604]|uniref:O-antigen ligase family protein n=1 Tax=Streptomyces sp. NPDC048604 TaxID=3365578 RepID=UPI003710A962